MMQSEEKETIAIIIENGIVTNIVNDDDVWPDCLENVRVVVQDFDIDGVDPDNLERRDPDGYLHHEYEV